jgi:hypothetical protein
MALLQAGNSKLGRGIWAFGLPAGSTCPGKTKSCSKACYATKGFYRMKSVKTYLRRSKAASRRQAFVQAVRSEMREIMPSAVRWHTSGDFYDAEYARKFLQLVRAEPRTTFLVYTRSWNQPEIAEVLKECALEKNCMLWLSCDTEMGSPVRWKGVAGIAFMALSDADQPTFPVDLVFFVNKPSKQTRFFGKTLVCPFEQNGPKSKEFTCSTCRYCLSRQPRGRWKHKAQEQKATRRVALAVV